MSKDDEASAGVSPEELEEFKTSMTDTEGCDPEPVADEEEPTPSDSDDDQAAAPVEDEPTGDEPVTDEPEGDEEQSTSDDDPWQKTHTFKGETKTLKQWLEEEKLEQIFTNANQSAHLQEKHRQRVEEEKKAKEETEAQAAAQAQQRPQLTKEQLGQRATQLKDAYMPQMTAMAEAGIIEKELVEDAPKFVAQIMHVLDGFGKKAAGYDKLMHAIQGEREQAAMVTQEQEGVNVIVTATDNVAASGEAYSGLNDPEHRQEFYNWLGSEQNPLHEEDESHYLSMLDKGLMLTLYTKYLTDTGVKPPIGNPAADAQAAEARAQAGGGGGGGGRVSTPRPPKDNELSEFARAMRDEDLA